MATHLVSAAASLELTAYRGVLSPQLLDAPTREIAALVSGAAIHDLGWLKRVAVRGEDRFRWLSGMVTNTVNDLAPSSGAWNLVLNAQGRIQGDLYVWREGSFNAADTLELQIAADQYEKLLAHLDRFIIMDDVELVPLPDSTALGVTGPHAADVLARLGLPMPTEPLTSAQAAWNGLEVRVTRGYGVLVPHYELGIHSSEISKLWTVLTEAGALPIGTASLDVLRFAEGIPAYGVDMMERDLPQETAQMRALHFAKGCYLGQEIVERIRSRGNVHRHLRQLELDGPLPEANTELFFQNAVGAEAPAGQITSAVELSLPSGSRRLAFAMIRGEAELRNQPITYKTGAETGTARILSAPPSLDATQIGSLQP